MGDVKLSVVQLEKLLSLIHNSATITEHNASKRLRETKKGRQQMIAGEMKTAQWWLTLLKDGTGRPVTCWVSSLWFSVIQPSFPFISECVVS